MNGSVAYTNSKQVGGNCGNNQADSEEAASSLPEAFGFTNGSGPYED